MDKYCIFSSSVGVQRAGDVPVELSWKLLLKGYTLIASRSFNLEEKIEIKIFTNHRSQIKCPILHGT